MTIQLHQGDCLQILKTFEENSVDSLVTDPPAGISFMGKDWDGDKGGSKHWIAWMSEVMRECLRVMKPGAHGLVWAIPRTSHWTATALEDAGFEVRDVVTHLFGSGFPKSLDISKQLDKMAGAEREVIGEKITGKARTAEGWKGGQQMAAPSTPEAKLWQGWGTALKPASEHWILVRKPCSEKTVASNVLKHGTGGINIEASRIASGDQETLAKNWDRKTVTDMRSGNYGNGTASGIELSTKAPQGRFPANLVLSHNDDCSNELSIPCTPGCAVAELDRQASTFYTDSGGASRFFYCAKASKSEKNAGCEGLEAKRTYGNDKGDGLGRGISNSHIPNQNHHPTVKPLKLMSYLIKMITPPNGIVLDPFMGSGSTGVAANREGFQFIGIEQNPEYIQIAEKRIYYAFPKFKKDIQKCTSK